MEELLKESYNFQLVDADPKHTKYDFVSVGTKEIPKRVSIQQYEYKGLERYFNLGFSNIEILDNGQEVLSDMSRKNNKTDKDKVLKTVFVCALDFLSENQNAILTFFGNTKAKHRLYKMGLSNNLSSIKECFVIKGAIIPNLKIKEDEDGSKTPNTIIDPKAIQYEQYNKENSHSYNFLTFELKKHLK